MYRTFKFRLYPNTNQKRELEIALETHRRLYNLCLKQREDSYQLYKKNITFFDQVAQLKNLRKENKYVKRINSTSAASTIQRVDKTYSAFFRRIKTNRKAGRPRFKSPSQFNSFSYPSYGNGIHLKNNKLKLQHIGTIRCKFHRPIDGTIKSTIIKRENDKWFVIFLCDLGNIQVEPSTNPAVGIDVGLENFLTTSDGKTIKNPRFFKRALPELKKRRRSVARKKEGGKNKQKAWKTLQKLNTHVKNQRHDHRHKTALSLIRCYGLIAVENLNIQSMCRDPRFSQAITDAAWGSFLVTLRHKAERAGVVVVEVDAYGTSQECSGCGQEVLKDLYARKHNCPHCGLSLHRDVNAARNILARALQVRTGPVGVNGKGFSVVQEAASLN
jgi:putative transposase